MFVCKYICIRYTLLISNDISKIFSEYLQLLTLFIYPSRSPDDNAVTKQRGPAFLPALGLGGFRFLAFAGRCSSNQLNPFQSRTVSINALFIFGLNWLFLKLLFERHQEKSE